MNPYASIVRDYARSFRDGPMPEAGRVQASEPGTAAGRRAPGPPAGCSRCLPGRAPGWRRLSSMDKPDDFAPDAVHP